MCFTPYEYRKISEMLLELMKLCDIMGRRAGKLVGTRTGVEEEEHEQERRADAAACLELGCVEQAAGKRAGGHGKYGTRRNNPCRARPSSKFVYGHRKRHS